MAGYSHSFQIMDSVVNDDDPATVYSNKFSTGRADVWSTHFEGASVSTYSATVTLWASNKIDPSEADDTDWVEIDAEGGFDGLPGGNPSSASAFKDFVDVGISGARWYRWKFVRSAGSATLSAWATVKNRGR